MLNLNIRIYHAKFDFKSTLWKEVGRGGTAQHIRKRISISTHFMWIMEISYFEAKLIISKDFLKTVSWNDTRAKNPIFGHNIIKHIFTFHFKFYCDYIKDNKHTLLCELQNLALRILNLTRKSKIPFFFLNSLFLLSAHKAHFLFSVVSFRCYFWNDMSFRTILCTRQFQIYERKTQKLNVVSNDCLRKTQK